MTGVPGIVYRAIATHLIHKAGYTKQTAHTGAVTLIQRFGSALNLNIHLHVLFLDGAYIAGTKGTSARFHRVNEPSSGELTQLVLKIAHRVGRKVFTLNRLPPVDIDEMHTCAGMMSEWDSSAPDTFSHVDVSERMR